MSQHSDDQLLQAGSDSFWEPGNYKRTTRRIEDGYKLCTDLQTLIHERAEIEKAYAKSLRGWSKKWADLIEKGPEHGTMEAACKSILIEAERISDVHSIVYEDLCSGEIQKIKTWQKENYHKVNVIQIKERKEMEDLFKKAQKPWTKRLAQVEKTKADYYRACKVEKTAMNQERTVSADITVPRDQIKKLQDRVDHAKDETQKSRERYKQALQEMNIYSPVYIEDMSSVFAKCQYLEETRLKFFKKMLLSTVRTLHKTQDPTLPQMYEELCHTISNVDHQKDLIWWSKNRGVNTTMSKPSFIAYPENE